MYKKTKIVATIGPSCWDNDVLTKMIEAGLNVARINTSHAVEGEVERVSKQIRSLSDDVAILVDLEGPKIRLNDFGEPIEIRDGEEIVFGCEEGSQKITVSYKGLCKDVKVGTRLLVDDGKLLFDVLRIEGSNVFARAVKGGLMKKKKTLNVPGVHLSFSGLTEKDYNNVLLAVNVGADYISGSFIRNVEDVQNHRSLIQNTNIKIISKIENPEGVMNFDAILQASDGVMVARGDLGVELPAHQVPVLQKRFIKQCNSAGKPVIVATQMLESMTENPSPTRAEVNDVANAIFDGADAVMLSGESSVGKYPVEAVRVMSNVAREVEPNIDPIMVSGMAGAKPATNAIVRAVADICLDLPIDKVLVATATGTTAIALSRFHLKQPIFAFTRDATFKRRLALHRGIQGDVIEAAGSSRDLGVKAVAIDAYKAGFVSESDLVVVVAGANIMGQGATNMLEIQRIGELLTE